MALSLMMHWQLSGKLLLEVCTWVLLPTVVHDSDTTASFEKGGGGAQGRVLSGPCCGLVEGSMSCSKQQHLP